MDKILKSKQRFSKGEPAKAKTKFYKLSKKHSLTLKGSTVGSFNPKKKALKNFGADMFNKLNASIKIGRRSFGLDNRLQTEFPLKKLT